MAKPILPFPCFCVRQHEERLGPRKGTYDIELAVNWQHCTVKAGQLEFQKGRQQLTTVWDALM